MQAIIGAGAMLPAPAAGLHAQLAGAPGLQPAQLAIVVNDAKPNSVKVGEY